MSARRTTCTERLNGWRLIMRWVPWSCKPTTLRPERVLCRLGIVGVGGLAEWRLIIKDSVQAGEITKFLPKVA